MTDDKIFSSLAEERSKEFKKMAGDIE